MKAAPPKPRAEAESLKLVKVWVPIPLLEKINAERGDIALSSWCRDSLAGRMMPDPSFAATQQVVRTASRLTNLVFKLDAMMDHREQFSRDEMRIVGSLITLERDVRALREDCKQLIHFVALEQLNRAGVQEKPHDR
jgi:hypothetical protein